MLILSFNTIELRNFPVGRFRHEVLEPLRAKEIIDQALTTGDHYFSYDISAVEKEDEHKDFRAALAVLKDGFDIEIDPKVFANKHIDPDDETERYFPHFSGLVPLGAEDQLLVIEYGYTIDRGQVPTLEAMRVSKSTFKFHLFEME